MPVGRTTDSSSTRRRARSHRTRATCLVLACVASVVAGGYLAIRAFGTTVEPITLGTARVSAVPSLKGAVDVYVPVVDWGVRARPFRAPVRIQVRFRSLDRPQARAALASGPAAGARLDSLRSDFTTVFERALRRAAFLGVCGGLAGGLFAGGLIGAVVHRTRWLGYGLALGVAVPLVYAAAVGVTLRPIDYRAFETPTFYAHGSELPKLLTFSRQLGTVGDSYTKSYEQALAGLANLVAFAGRRQAGDAEDDRTVVVMSDLHSNGLVLPVLDEYARRKTVFAVGDFALLGSHIESRLAPDIGRLGSRVVAVSGNHDSRPLMGRLVRAGVTVLTRTGRLRADGSTDGSTVVDVGGLSVAGYDDPLEAGGALMNGHALQLHGERLADEARHFVAWFAALPRRPDVVLVHQHGLAHALLRTVRPSDPPLAILTGHDHKQHLEQHGSTVLVDGGTVGAGGPLAIGEQDVGFAEVRFDTDRAVSVDLISVEPLSGNAVARRVVLAQQPGN